MQKSNGKLKNGKKIFILQFSFFHENPFPFSGGALARTIRKIGRRLKGIV